MKRREALGLAASGSVGLLSARGAEADMRVERALRAQPSPKIKDVRAIATAPAGLRLVVVKITTDQDGLYGYGCATFTQRADLVPPAVERYLKPFLVGKPADRRAGPLRRSADRGRGSRRYRWKPREAPFDRGWSCHPRLPAS